jgi:hypothetical protein
MPLTTEIFIISANGPLMTLLAHFRILVGQENRPWDFPIGVEVISSSISEGTIGVKKNESLNRLSVK